MFLFQVSSIFYYTRHTMQYDIREQTHVHTIIQVVCCWIQTEKWKKKQKTNNFNNNKNKCNLKIK